MSEPTMICDERGYVLTLQRNGLPKTYIFSEHTVGTCVAYETVKGEQLDGMDATVLATALADNNGFIYYLCAQHTNGHTTWVRLTGPNEAKSINHAIRTFSMADE